MNIEAARKTRANNRTNAKANDTIYTPKPVAERMIEMCGITSNMTVLDCSRGGGVFYDNLPECKKSYCEITEGFDFFEWREPVDLIIGNPPYSLWDKWIDHTLTLTNKFCYIFGTSNLTEVRMRRIMNAGFGITRFCLLKVDWWFSPSFLIVFEKGQPNIIDVITDKIYCDICSGGGRSCGRGRNGKSPNECGKKR